MSIFKILEKCEYKGLTFDVELEYYFDDIINEYYVDNELGNENLRKIRNKYRELNNLLLDSEIKEIRNQYNLSQRDFSIALGLGEVTITRYESKTVQDKSQDELIRQSKNPIFFLECLNNNKDKFIEVNGPLKYSQVYELTIELSKNIDILINLFSIEDRGNSKFTLDKLKGVIYKIKETRNVLTKTVLAKLLWYIDCLSFKLTNKSMTGIVYKSMPFGAYPELYDRILSDEDIKVELSWIKDYECYLIDDVKSDFELTNDEKNIIKFVVNKFKDFNAKEIVNYMHQEKAYQETELFNIISYNYSSNIRLFDDYK